MVNGSRIAVWLIGLLVVLAGLYVLWTETALSDVVPMGVAVAVVLLVLGVGVMAAAAQIRGEDRRVVHERRYEE